MTYEEAKQAYYEAVPVIHKDPLIHADVEYLYISALIKRRDWKGNHIHQVELMDRNKRSITIARPEHVRRKENVV